MRPGALSADGTRLAIPQPQALVVVDLTGATYRRYHVPGFNETATWADANHVLLGTEERRGGVLVDLANGSTADVLYHPLDTAYAPDGTAVELWQRPNDLPPYKLKRYGPVGLIEPIPLEVDLQNDFYQTIISVNGASIAMEREVDGWSVPRQLNEWGGPVSSISSQVIRSPSCRFTTPVSSSSRLPWTGWTMTRLSSDWRTMWWRGTTRAVISSG